MIFRDESFKDKKQLLLLHMQKKKEDIFCTTQPFVTKFSIVVHYYGVECYAENFACCLQGQGHSEGL